LVFGRVAYEKLAQYWPTAASNPDVSERHVEAARLMNELPKYVVSNHPESRAPGGWDAALQRRIR
jgi:hypothetical protein